MNDYQKQLIRLETIMPGIRESDRGKILKYYQDRDYIRLANVFIDALDKIYCRSPIRSERRK